MLNIGWRWLPQEEYAPVEVTSNEHFPFLQTEVHLVIGCSAGPPNTLIIHDILASGQPTSLSSYLYIPARLSFVDPHSLLVVIDKRQLLHATRRWCFSSPSIDIIIPFLLSEEITTCLGVNACVRLSPDAYTLYQYGCFFHHMLRVTVSYLRVIR